MRSGILSLLAAATLSASGLIITSCGKKSMEGIIIISQVKEIDSNPDLVTGRSWRNIEGSHLLALDPASPGKAAVELTGDFFSACSPVISYDGTHMLFSGQKKQGDVWQIWEMNLSSLKTRQVTSGNENSADPDYLPGNRLIFSREVKGDSLKSGYSLFTCGTDGGSLARITFNPHSYFASTVLMDGRVLSVSRQIFPESGRQSMMVMRPDGTKCELFFEDNDQKSLFSGGLETADGQVVFLQSDSSLNGRRNIVAVRYNRPLHSLVSLTDGISGDFYSASPDGAGRILVSYRASGTENFGLYSFNTEARTLGEPILKSNDHNVLEAVIVKAHQRPKKLPSEVDHGVKTGLLFCQNIAMTGLTAPENPFAENGPGSVEIMGVDSSLGVVDVEPDGSFYLKIAADVPFRLRTLDPSGNTVGGPGSWIWIRPNERRGCVGCHEDHEMVPANRVALAVKKDPVAVPVHVHGINEKKVELE